MASGNLSAAKDWLLQDLKSQATRRAQYYVMQANPNNAESLMYEAMNSGNGPQSNLRFLEGFLTDLRSLVLGARQQEPQIQINVIDTDFLSISQPYQICMQLMGFSPSLGSSPSFTESPDLTWRWLLRLSLMLVSAGLLVWTYRACRTPSGYQRHTS